jgi:hypothetical protein
MHLHRCLFTNRDTGTAPILIPFGHLVTGYVIRWYYFFLFFCFFLKTVSARYRYRDSRNLYRYMRIPRRDAPRRKEPRLLCITTRMWLNTLLSVPVGSFFFRKTSRPRIRMHQHWCLFTNRDTGTAPILIPFGHLVTGNGRWCLIWSFFLRSLFLYGTGIAIPTIRTDTCRSGGETSPERKSAHRLLEYHPYFANVFIILQYMHTISTGICTFCDDFCEKGHSTFYF